MKLAGKVALVIGGDRGIGKGIALGLGREGADVALTWFFSESGGRDTVDRLVGMGRRAVAAPADARKIADARAAVAASLDRFDRLDILVFNSGVTDPHPFLELTEEQYDGTAAELFSGDVAVLREGAVRRLRSPGGACLVVARE